MFQEDVLKRRVCRICSDRLSYALLPHMQQDWCSEGRFLTHFHSSLCLLPVSSVEHVNIIKAIQGSEPQKGKWQQVNVSAQWSLGHDMLCLPKKWSNPSNNILMASRLSERPGLDSTFLFQVASLSLWWWITIS